MLLRRFHPLLFISSCVLAEEDQSSCAYSRKLQQIIWWFNFSLISVYEVGRSILLFFLWKCYLFFEIICWIILCWQISGNVFVLNVIYLWAQAGFVSTSNTSGFLPSCLSRSVAVATVQIAHFLEGLCKFWDWTSLSVNVILAVGIFLFF